MILYLELTVQLQYVIIGWCDQNPLILLIAYLQFCPPLPGFFGLPGHMLLVKSIAISLEQTYCNSYLFVNSMVKPTSPLIFIDVFDGDSTTVFTFVGEFHHLYSQIKLIILPPVKERCHLLIEHSHGKIHHAVKLGKPSISRGHFSW